MVMVIDDYSFRAIPVEMLYGETLIASGTAFTYSQENRVYLITTWHNVTGRHNQTGKNLAATGARPSNLRFPARLNRFQRSTVASEDWASLSVPLYANDGATPLWLIHPQHGHLVDVVALPLRPETLGAPKFTLAPINEASNVDLSMTEGDDVFVLGYPEGLTGGLKFPIWKRGTIASVPSLDYKGLPLMLIDTTTGKGMSGAPVILPANVPSPPILARQGSGTATPRQRPAMFVGVYSGRVGGNGVTSQLGHIWRAEVIDQIIRSGRLDSTLA